jgi:hypothetical protein
VFVLVNLLLALSTGCGPVEEDVQPQVLLGTGEWDWEPLEEGDLMPVIQGPQGGHHLLGSVRIRGLESGDPGQLGDKSNPTTRFTVRLTGENLTPHSTYVQGLDPLDSEDSEWAHEMIGRFAILDVEDDSELDGLTLEFEVQVEDIDGRKASNALHVVAYPDPRND